MVKKANRKFMQAWNRQLALAIARDSGSVSQVDIMRKSGLSAGTVVNITRQLRKEKFLQPAGKGKSIGGRRPDILKFNTSARYIVSAVCLYKETQIAVVDLAGTIIGKIAFSTRPETGTDVFLSNFKDHVERLLKLTSIRTSRVMSLCVSFEGMVDARSGVLIDCVRLGWHNVPFKQYLRKLFDINIYIENNCRTAVLGEFIFGAGRSVRNLVYIALESGIGASIIHEGHLYHGPYQMEGEIGHTVKDPSGPVCKCGKRGCLEALASGPAIIFAARDAMVPAMNETINSSTEEEAFDHILNMAEQGHESARNILRKAAALLGNAIADVINLIDTEMVVLAGYMVEKSSEYFFEIIRDVASTQYLRNPKRNISIRRSALGSDAALIGGAALACQDVFSFPERQMP